MQRYVLRYMTSAMMMTLVGVSAVTPCSAGMGDVTGSPAVMTVTSPLSRRPIFFAVRIAFMPMLLKSPSSSVPTASTPQ